MIQLNLLPDIKREYLKARRVQARVISVAILACVVSAGVVVLAASWVFGVQAVQRASLSGNIDKKYKELTSIKDIDKYVTVQNQLANISSLHTNKPIMSRLFDILPAINPKAPHNIQITSLSVDVTTTTLSMQGSTDSYTGLEVLRDSLKNATVTYTTDESTEPTTAALFKPESVQFVSQGLGKDANGKEIASFSLALQYEPAVFARDTKSITITVPNKDTTFSKEDAPEVFNQGGAQ
jgi:Tfp pilus assembly protein PilN